MTINRVILVGRLTKAPELRYTPSGVAVATFTLAVNRTFTNQQGEKEADFINCVVWRQQAENTANFLRKGSMAGVDGRLQSRSYEDQQTGKRVFVTEVVAESVQFLDKKDNSGGSGGSQESGNYQNNTNTYNNNQNRNTGQNGASGRDNGYSGGAGNSYDRRADQQSRYQGQGYKRVDDDPFANNGQAIDISDDDLPF